MSDIAILIARIHELESQKRRAVKALEATQKLLDEIYEEDIVLSQNLDAVYEKNKQALAQVDN